VPRYNVVAADLLANVTAVVAQYPDYTIIPLGHSLGGSLASITSVIFRANFPNKYIQLYVEMYFMPMLMTALSSCSAMRLYTYGQPRTGNAIYASWVESEMGTNAFRGTPASQNQVLVTELSCFPSKPRSRA
jgi:predicted lipase